MARRPRSSGSGAIFARKGTKKLYISFHGTQIATGHDDTPAGREMARRMLDHLNAQHARGKGLLPPAHHELAHTLYEAFEEFLRKEGASKREKTREWYRLSIKRMFPTDFPLREKVQKGALTLLRLELEVERAIIEKRFTPQTTVIYLRGVSKFVNWCYEEGLLDVQPRMKRLRKMVMNVPTKPIRIFTNEELTTLVEHFQQTHPQLSLLIEFLSLTGLRLHEALEMQWADVKNDIIEVVSKDSRKYDYVVVTPEIGDVLERLRTVNAERKVFSWNAKSTSRLRSWLYEGFAVCGIERNDRAFHELRKTYISRLVMKGLNSFQIAKLARCRVRVIEEHYLSIPTEVLRSTVSL